MPQTEGAGAAFAVFRAAYVCAGLLGLLLAARRGGARVLAGTLVALNVAAWAAYVLPLGRPYALEQRLDRAFNVGLAACAAADGRVFEHVQVGQAAVEPFWSALVAALSGFEPGRVAPLYGWLTPLALVTVGVAVYAGARGDQRAHDWRAALAVLAVLGLSSWSLSMQPPTPLFWAGNFLLKPNHAFGFALLAGLGLPAVAKSPWRQGLLLGALGWVFLPHLVFAGAALALDCWLRPASERRFRALLGACVLAACVAAPGVANLWRDYAPTAAGASARGLWRQPRMGAALAHPQWLLLDAAPLCLLAALGARGLRRHDPRERWQLALVGSAGGSWLAYALASPLGFAPSPDDAHYFQRFALALAAGSGLYALAGWLRDAFRLDVRVAASRVAAVCLPLTFPAYWDPPGMDRYYALSRPPVPAEIQEAAAWVREHTPAGAVFAGGEQSATWLPVLAGRRVLLSADFRPPADYEHRREVERRLLTSSDAGARQAAAAEYGVTYVALDAPLREAYGQTLHVASGAYESVFANGWVEILRLR